MRLNLKEIGGVLLVLRLFVLLDIRRFGFGGRQRFFECNLLGHGVVIWFTETLYGLLVSRVLLFSVELL